MINYIATFTNEDKDRVFRLLATFSRWEYALKRTGYAKPGSHGQAEADWNKYVDAVAIPLAQIATPRYVAARNYITTHPPLCWQYRDGWQPNPKRENETEARYLFRMVRDVRNNLFHGGKFQNGIVEELSRDREVIDAATTVLEECVNLRPEMQREFE